MRNLSIILILACDMHKRKQLLSHNGPVRSGSTCRAEKAKMIGKGRKEDSSNVLAVIKIMNQKN